MKIKIVHNLFCWAQDFLERPAKVLLLCLFMVFISLVWEGSLWQLWTLNQESDRLQSKMDDVTKLSRHLDMKIERASELTYIDRQARDRFDLVGKDDLIFIFSDRRSTEDAARN